MNTTVRHWRVILAWGMVLVAVLMAGAVADVLRLTGTCMFILVAYFAAIAGTYPVLAVNRAGTGLAVMLPYAIIGFLPLYYFDYLQQGNLLGAWAVWVWTAAGPIIGVSMDLAYTASAGRSGRTRAILVGAVMQATQFVVATLGLRYLYTPTSSMASHLYMYTEQWFFTLPWMALNGAFGGYTAYALRKRV
jgi:hypothetical protein